ncbi:MAG: hypothetical protein ACI38A_07035 [Candidatus Ornithomonoglobus sp.]
MERYQKQFHFLYEHNIETTEGLAVHQSKAEADIEDLTAERKSLYKLKDDPESDERIKQINSDLKKLREDVKMCRNIFVDVERIQNMSERAKQLEKDPVKDRKIKKQHKMFR